MSELTPNPFWWIETSPRIFRTSWRNMYAIIEPNGRQRWCCLVRLDAYPGGLDLFSSYASRTYSETQEGAQRLAECILKAFAWDTEAGENRIP